jgi:hypothetical protein
MITDNLYFKVEKLAKGIREELRSKGFVVPTDNGDGTVTVDNYTIVKERSGFYAIKDRDNDTVVEHINLPQTAALLANGLALGKWVDDSLLRVDQRYGYSLFEELQSKRIIERSNKRKDYDKLDLMCVKMADAIERKNSAKATIFNSFEKLRRLR